MVTEMSKLWTDPVFLATISGGQTNGAVADPVNGSIMAIRGGGRPARSPATAKPGPDKTAKLLAPRAAAAKPPTPLDGDQKRLRAELAAELEKQRAAFRKFDGYAEPLAKKIAAAQ